MVGIQLRMSESPTVWQTCVSFLKDLFWKIQTFFFQWLTHGQEEVERIVNVFQHKPMENMYNLEA